MIDICRCSDEDFNIKLWNSITKRYGIINKIEYFYELWVDGCRSYLINQGNNFYILNSNCGVDHFSVIDNQVVYYHCGLSGISLKSGNVYKFDDFNRLIDYISIVPYTGSEVRYQNVNASLNHTHFDYEHKMRYLLSYYYDANFDNKDKISQAYLNEPYYVEVENISDDLAGKKTYYLTHWYEEEKYYEIALLRTVGVAHYLFKKYAGDIDVYYDRKVKNGDEVSFKNLFLSEQLNPNDIDNVLLDEGYDGYISQDIIDAFNKEDERYKFYQNIYDQWLKVYKKDRLSYRLTV